MLNFECPARLLEPRVPRGTELDLWRDRVLVSLVGFMFRDTRVRGIPIPFHRTFEEVNLRFYVRRHVGNETRRGVVFIRELVPRRAIAAVARWRYNEPYTAVPMDHEIAVTPERGGRVEYSWRLDDDRFALRGRASGPPREPGAGTEAEFITEHHWGYTRQRDGSTLEYGVEHPRWRTWSVEESRASGPLERIYGADFAAVLEAPPRSAFLVPGSPVSVFEGRPV